MKEYRQKEQKLNQGISTYLKSQYGHNGEFQQPKGKPRDLITLQIKKKVNAGRNKSSGMTKEQSDENEEDFKPPPVLTKKEIQM